jgi:hypothetical protein
MQSHQVPSFFCTNTIGLPQGDELGQMCPLWSNSWICRLISSFSNREQMIDWPIGQWCVGGQIDGVLDLAVQRYPGR